MVHLLRSVLAEEALCGQAISAAATPVVCPLDEICEECQALAGVFYFPAFEVSDDLVSMSELVGTCGSVLMS